MVTSRVFTGTYSYVEVNNIQRDTATEHRVSAGVIGIMTAAADMPSGGTATYTGEASAETLSLGAGTTYDYNRGTSTVTANFGAGTVDVTLDAFTQIEKRPFGAAPSTITAAAAPLDQIHGSGLAINGTHFTGMIQPYPRLPRSVGLFFGSSGRYLRFVRDIHRPIGNGVLEMRMGM